MHQENLCIENFPDNTKNINKESFFLLWGGGSLPTGFFGDWFLLGNNCNFKKSPNRMVPISI
jgi:hypothetical protein